ncbi:MAG: FAD-dependent oxidoreductase [Chloroflexi bacterium]|nr:FAD-dependent oxidoreductase [Chloroflexota bacterium]
MATDYDVLIVGGGLAGMTAGIYAARYGMSTAIIERMMGGAQIINIEKIENYPGFPQGISGAELGPAVQEQAMDCGVEFVMAEASGIATSGGGLSVTTDAGQHQAKAVIVAAGSSFRQLGIPGEEELFGRGVSHCATCDGPLFMNQVVGVVGGGDSAVDEALTLTEYAQRVLVFSRRGELRAQQVLQDRLRANPKVEVMWNTLVEGVLGEETVSGVAVRNVATGLESQVGLSGLFVYVGLQPGSDLVKDLVSLDNAGHIPVDISMATPVPGLFAVGDIRQHSSSQLISAAGDGATAAIAAFNYIRGLAG